jgi:hypothetical protein
MLRKRKNEILRKRKNEILRKRKNETETTTRFFLEGGGGRGEEKPKSHGQKVITVDTPSLTVWSN